MIALVMGTATIAAPPMARAQGLQLSAQPVLTPAFDPTVTDYVTPCTSNVPVSVTVSAPAGMTVDVDGHGPQSGNYTTSVGLNPGQSFVVTASQGGSPSTYYVRCLPADFPGWTFQRSATPQAEWYLLVPWSSPNYGTVFDTNGAPVWWYKNPVLTGDFKLLPDGNLAWLHDDGSAEERRLDGSLVRTISVPAPARIDPHEVLQLPNGDYLLTVGRALAGQTVCGISNLTIADNGFEEITPGGGLVRSWWASDHVPLSEVTAAWCHAIISAPFGGIYDPYHINAVEPDGTGYLVSLRRMDAVYGINQADGGVTWKLGGTPRAESLSVSGDPFAASGDLFRGQHDVRVLPDSTVTVYDNGFHPGAQRPPRAVRYAIDPQARTAVLLEQITNPPQARVSVRTGSARKLPFGNWVIDWGSAGIATEVTSTNAPVMSLRFGLDSANKQIFSYRGQPLLPGVLDRQALRDGMDRQFPRGYPRPRGAGLIRASLVPASDQCTAPNSTHGGPVAFGSCSPPSASSLLTVGTPDANGLDSKSSGYVLHNVLPPNPAASVKGDVGVQVAITDVRRKQDLSAYTGQLQVQDAVRITDRLNGGASDEAATGADTTFPFTVPCAAVANPSIGATCGVTTSFNALVPGAVVDGKRAIWQLGPVQVFDGGASETAGASDAHLFEQQGLYVP